MKRDRKTLIKRSFNFDKNVLTLIDYHTGIQLARKAKVSNNCFYLLLLICNSPGLTAEEIKPFTGVSQHLIFRDLSQLLNGAYIVSNELKQYRATDEGRYLLRTCLPSFGIE